MIARSRPRTADIRRDRWSELQEPPPDRLVRCVNASLGQQFLNIPKGQCEPGIEPDRVADDFWRESVALKRYRAHRRMLIGDEPQSYPSYRDIAPLHHSAKFSRARPRSSAGSIISSGAKAIPRPIANEQMDTAQYAAAARCSIELPQMESRTCYCRSNRSGIASALVPPHKFCRKLDISRPINA